MTAATAATIQRKLARKYPGLEITARKANAKISLADVDSDLEGTTGPAFVVTFTGKTASFTEVIPAAEIATDGDAYRLLRRYADDLASDEGVL
jgi:hypothetical protein